MTPAFAFWKERPESPDDCPWPHHVQTLVGVPVTPVEELPQVCVCGHVLTYSPDLAFVQYQGLSGVMSVPEPKE